MGLGDLGNAFLIVTIFTLIQLFITLITSLAQFKKIWNKYKCNPAIMPFATLVGHDPVTVFRECTVETQRSFMATFLDPIYTSLNSFTESGNIFLGLLDSLQIGLNTQQLQSLDVVQNIGDRVSVFSNNLNKTFITIADTVSKVGGIITVIHYLVLTSVELGRALSRDAPGQVLRVLTGQPQMGG
jgi:hypothetical protein